MGAADAVERYGARFQLAFLFKDAKQHTGLDHCQVRDPEKLHFHWNAALTSVNLARWVRKKNRSRWPMLKRSLTINCSLIYF